MNAPKWSDRDWLNAELIRAEAVSMKRSEARAALPPGSSRARVTSANAKWATAAEYRDRVAARIAELAEAPRVTVRVVAVDAEGDDEFVGGALQLAGALIANARGGDQ